MAKDLAVLEMRAVAGMNVSLKRPVSVVPRVLGRRQDMIGSRDNIPQHGRMACLCS